MQLRCALAALVFLAQPGLGAAAGCALSQDVYGTDLPEVQAAGLTGHFRQWLTANGYESYDFARDDLPGGSYGGKSSHEHPVTHQPVVFVHGNSDRAVGEDEGPIGWAAVIAYYLTRGYSTAELYATTWGSANPELAAEQDHSLENVRRIRAFMEAVLGYTGAGRIDVIAHSMGVTLARRAILGGKMDAHDLGPPLTNRVDAFVGIAGANQGLATCLLAESEPTCSDEDGFFPGYPSFLGVVGESEFLADLNARSGYEGKRVYSIWSRTDQLIGFGGLVYGNYTSRIPGQDGEKVYRGYPYGHFCVRDLSADVQLEMIQGRGPSTAAPNSR